MAKLLQLLNEWEIQLLVLFSFTLQVFLFFTSSLRRCTTSKFIRLLIWMAYLGADLVAVYALGFLSRHDDATTGKDTLRGTHQLAFFWTSFLLIHLGGQDTITAFAIEDNNLWLRHLLNLVVQATLALYIFWKSTNGPSMQLIVPSILLFVTGTIKYGERIWALWGGSLGKLYTLESSTDVNSDSRSIDRDYSDIISMAIHLIRGVRDVFDDFGVNYYSINLWGEVEPIESDKLCMIMEIELGLMYDDIYTKATVIRTRGGIVLRCISQISFVAAFVLFFVSNKQRYNSVDTVITYALFIGGFSLEVCAIFITMMSPWTWAWLKKRRERRGLYRFLLSINDGWQRKRQLWSDSMGQYSVLNYLGQNDHLQSNYLGQNDQLQSSLWKRCVMAAIIKVVNNDQLQLGLRQLGLRQLCLWKERVMAAIRKVVNLAIRKVVNLVFGVKQKLWISTLLDTKFIKTDKEIMECVIKRVDRYRSAESNMGPQLPSVGPLLEIILSQSSGSFAAVIVGLHMYTELLLSESSTPTTRARLCRKISNYMLYLLFTHPEMLPVKKSELPLFLKKTLAGNLGDNSVKDRAKVTLRALRFTGPFPEICTEALLLEIQEAWIGLLMYAAGKSRPEAHAAQLARGGELLTFVWLLMAHHLLGDVRDRIELADIFHVEEESRHPRGLDRAPHVRGPQVRA